MGVVKRLDELLCLQVPLLDAHVPGGGEECVPRDGHALDPVVVGRIETDLGRDNTTLVLRHIKHLHCNFYIKMNRAKSPTWSFSTYCIRVTKVLLRF